MIRILTGLSLVALIVLHLFLLSINPLYFAILNAIITALCIYEMNKALKDNMPKPYSILNIFLAVLLLPSFLINKSLSGVFVLLAIIFLIAFVMFTFNFNISLTAFQSFILILFYPALLLSFNYALIYNPNALFLLTAVFGIGPMADTFAYAVGITFKGKKLCPRVSPKKTVSGAIGGLFGGIIAGVAIYFVFLNFLPHVAIPSLGIMALVGCIGAFFTEAGDLAESALKRRFNIKDFGSILPGHGGILDRVDGIMFNSIFVFAFFSYITPFI